MQLSKYLMGDLEILESKAGSMLEEYLILFGKEEDILRRLPVALVAFVFAVALVVVAHKSA
jgi:hypothetical protein